MTEHSPGPWYVEPHVKGVSWHVGPARTFEKIGPRGEDLHGQYVVAIVKDSEASAHLIASAPDLLAALDACRTELVAVLREDSNMTEAAIEKFPVVVQASAAIAKARGRAK